MTLGSSGYAALVLAGGPGRRMGHRAKPTLRVGGVALLSRVLIAVADATPRIVVGPPAGLDLPADVRTTVEDPPGGGPVAGIAAGLDLLDDADESPHVAVLAADLPFLASEDLLALRAAAGRGGYDGAVLVDDEARPQWLCGVWRLGPLRSRLAEVGDPAGVAVRALVDPLSVAHVTPSASAPPTWFDCDTEDDLRRAEEWVHGDTR